MSSKDTHMASLWETSSSRPTDMQENVTPPEVAGESSSANYSRKHKLPDSSDGHASLLDDSSGDGVLSIKPQSQKKKRKRKKKPRIKREESEGKGAGDSLNIPDIQINQSAINEPQIAAYDTNIVLFLDYEVEWLPLHHKNQAANILLPASVLQARFPALWTFRQDLADGRIRLPIREQYYIKEKGRHDNVGPGMLDGYTRMFVKPILGYYASTDDDTIARTVFDFEEEDLWRALVIWHNAQNGEQIELQDVYEKSRVRFVGQWLKVEQRLLKMLESVELPNPPVWTEPFNSIAQRVMKLSDRLRRG